MYTAALLLSIPLLTTTTDYPALKERIEEKRRSFTASYQVADSADRVAIIDSARSYLFDLITLDILPAWYGTPWDFNGTTRTPGTGTIACGYFVNTVLQDAGFRLPRIKWSQMPSEPITVKLSHRIERFRNRPVSEVISYIRSQGDGLYKVGLDNHVGFIVARSGVIRFVHSNYYRRGNDVMSEPLDGDNPLANSKYRIVGSLLGDEMIKAWIEGSELGATR